jgi:hypothetical protein
MNGRMRRGSALLLALLLTLTPLVLTADETPDPTTPNTSSTSQPSDPLVRLLVSKGVLSADEAKYVGAGTADNQREKLIFLLKEKGLLNSAEVSDLRSSTPPIDVKTIPVAATTNAMVRPAVYTTIDAKPQAAQAKTETKPAPPKFVPAVAPLRVLQTEPSKKDGMIPDVKLGSNARIKFYGFVKASAVIDSSSPYGNDFPLPGYIGSIDTGPNTGREFHIKARAMRWGTNFEWPDVSDRLTLSGKFEYDFEGNFSRVSNRNISSIRSSMASIRVAWGRFDYKASDTNTIYGVFGQDWTPFGSSTLPNIVETTGLGIGFGVLWERSPQMRFGWAHNFGGSRKVLIAPEVALVLPTSGNPPTLIDNQLAYGERQGPDSSRPNLQGRLVTQWVLDPAPGVLPAQFIISFMDGKRQVGVPAASLSAAQKVLYPTGVAVSSDQWGATGEIQLPTRYVTVLAKYYTGADLRYYFAGGLYSTYNDVTGLTAVSSVASVDGSAVLFGTTAGGQVVYAAQRPVRSQGGFVNLGFPLGRIFHVDPASRASGLQLYAHYGLDDPYARDVRHVGVATTGPAAGLSQTGRDKSDAFIGTLLWKLNPFLTLGFEQSQYRTRLSGGAAFGAVVGGTPTWAGTSSRQWHDNRTEISTTFTF